MPSMQRLTRTAVGVRPILPRDAGRRPTGHHNIAVTGQAEGPLSAPQCRGRVGTEQQFTISRCSIYFSASGDEPSEWVLVL